MKKKDGFTLVELLVVISIIVVLAIIMVGALNPIKLVDKGNDAQRKKDLSRIKVAFEEYYADKGCYPDPTSWLPLMTDRSSCNGRFFESWLSSWPCDPKGNPYVFQFESSGCPRWFKIMSFFDNTDDTDIPSIVRTYSDDGFLYVSGNKVNYGVSSTNIQWYDTRTVMSCGSERNCYTQDQYGICIPATVAGQSYSQCTGENCFFSPSCISSCQTFYCNSLDL